MDDFAEMAKLTCLLKEGGIIIFYKRLEILYGLSAENG